MVVSGAWGLGPGAEGKGEKENNAKIWKLEKGKMTKWEKLGKERRGKGKEKKREGRKRRRERRNVN